MSEWITVIGLVVFGIILIIVEIVFIPGTTIVGILGCIFGLSGIYLGFQYFGNTVGTIVASVSVVLAVSAIVVSLRNGVWDKLSLKSKLTARVNEDFVQKVGVGEVGKALSTIKPIGNGIFGEKIVEVRSNGDYIAVDSEIRVSKIEESKIYVESILNQ